VKNHNFIIDLFSEIKKSEENAILLLIGSGKLLPEIKEKVFELTLKDSVIFLENKNEKEVAAIMSAMDVFVLPSHSEAVSVVAVEAQASGLPVLLSDNMSDEILLTRTAKMLPLAGGGSSIYEPQKSPDTDFVRTIYTTSASAAQNYNR
jgi:glycosyltransferase involved in cell wall biosynthesis